MDQAVHAKQKSLILEDFCHKEWSNILQARIDRFLAAAKVFTSCETEAKRAAYLVLTAQVTPTFVMVFPFKLF